MSVHAATWTGRCTGCHREDIEVGSRRSHGERVLCAACAAKPYGMPSASGLVDLSTATDRRPGTNDAKAGRYDGRLVDVSALLAELDTPIPWRCDRFAADGYLTVLAGRGGEGKSWLALALALGVATGTPRAGIGCRHGRALIFDAENGRDLLRRRLRAAGVTDGVGIVLVDGLDLVKDAEWFTKIIRDEKANLVVFDSLRVLTSGRDEDKSGDMEKPLSTLRRIARSTGAAVVLVHHRGKGLADFRGSSVIADQTDLLFALGREAGDPQQRTRRKLYTGKCRIDEEPDARWVAILANRALGLVTVDAAEPYEPDGSARPRDSLRDDVLELLTKSAQSGAQIARSLGRDKTDGTVRRVLDDLQADGLAEKRPGGWGLPVANPYEMATVATPGGHPAGVCSCVHPGRAWTEPDEDIARCARCGRRTTA
jgi:AAA domain